MSSLFSLSYKQLAVNNYIKKETDSFETASLTQIKSVKKEIPRPGCSISALNKNLPVATTFHGNNSAIVIHFQLNNFNAS